MILNARQEPPILDSAEPGISDFRPDADFKADARRGSRKLLYALLKLQKAPKKRIVEFRPRTWEARQKARAETRRIQNAAADYFQIQVTELTGIRGPAELARQRQIAMFVARVTTTASYPDIGHCFGGRDHTTVLHGCRMVESDPVALGEAQRLKELLA